MSKGGRLIKSALRFSLVAWLALIAWGAHGQVEHDAEAKTVRITTADKRLSLHVDYTSGGKVTELTVNNKNTLAPAGIFTAVRTADAHWTSSSGQDQRSEEHTTEIQSLMR